MNDWAIDCHGDQQRWVRYPGVQEALRSMALELVGWQADRHDRIYPMGRGSGAKFK